MIQSSIGRKALMAFTGLGLVGFVIVHMIGNLQIYLGPDAINKYAETLKSLPALLWGARLGLLVLFSLHVYLGITLWMENQAARPVKYVRYEPKRSTHSSRHMLLSGLVILAFVIYHLLHFTIGVVLPDAYNSEQIVAGKARHDVYTMVVLGFKNPIVSASYIVAQLFLGMHLYHAIPSLFQSLGLKHPKYNSTIVTVGLIVTLAVVVGNISIPLSILFGLVGSGVGG